MSLLHKIRKTRPKSFILSSESLAWVLDKASRSFLLQYTMSPTDQRQGKHVIEIDHSVMGQTCGILPVGIDCAYVKTDGLKWNLGKSTYDESSRQVLTSRLGDLIRWRCL